MTRIRAIIKRPDERFGHVAEIGDTLKDLQDIVGGNIETLQIAASTVMIMNEEGKLRQDCEPNFFIREAHFADVICGNVVLLGIAGDDFMDCPIGLACWKKMLKKWGNMA